MPTLETDCLNQKAVYWAKNSKPDDFGEVTVDAGIEIKVRWEVGNQEVADPQGRTIGIESLVVVDRDISVGSILWLGTIADIANPPVDLRQVVIFNSIPDDKGRNFRRTVGVIRYSNSLPALA